MEELFVRIVNGFSHELFLQKSSIINIWKGHKYSSSHQICSVTKGVDQQLCLEETTTQVFSCEICEIFRNTYFRKHLRTAASANTPLFYIFSSFSVLMKPVNMDFVLALSITSACNFTKSSIPQWCFSRFSNCANGTK